jgi:uncharacterized protein YccT (UPF0319 family)
MNRLFSLISSFFAIGLGVYNKKVAKTFFKPKHQSIFKQDSHQPTVRYCSISRAVILRSVFSGNPLLISVKSNLNKIMEVIFIAL